MKPNTTLHTNLPKTLLVTAAAVLFAASAYAALPTPVSSCGTVALQRAFSSVTAMPFRRSFDSYRDS